MLFALFRNGERRIDRMKTKAGLALIVLGVAIFCVWRWWVNTRDFLPVNIAISAGGDRNISTQFRLNFDALYFIEIEAQKSLPLDQLHCLMGVEADAARCKGVATMIDANWSITNDGHEVAHGTSSELHSLSPESQAVNRVIGEFQGRAGHEYELRVEFAKDLSPLAAAHPRLKVVVAGIAYTDLQSAGVLVFSIGFICGLFGVILLVVGWYGKRGKGAE
jgi:hypothetical protein